MSASLAPRHQTHIRIWQTSCAALCLVAGLVAPALAAPSIGTQPLSEVLIYPQHSVSADITAQNQARVSAQVSGVIKHWKADVGETVRQGATLAEIDDTDWKLARDLARAQLTTAQAQLALAERQSKRAQELSAKGFFSPEALQQAETQRAVAAAQVQAAQVQVDQAERFLEKTRVVAPFTGEVTARTAQQGETVAVGSPLFQMIQLEGRELSAHLSLAQVQALSRLSQVTWIDASGKAEIAVKNARISQVADPKTRLYALRIAVPKDVKAGPGANGTLQWRDTQGHVPATLLVRRQNQLGVFISRDQKAEFHPLAQAQEGQPALINLPPNTSIVTSGQQSLQHGQSIQP